MSLDLRSHMRRLRYRLLRRRFDEYTIVGRRRYVSNLLLIERHRHIEGAVVECGVYRGGMMAGIACVLGPRREYVLFDSFEGLPEPKPIDGERALAWAQDVESPDYHENCAAEESWARRAMELAGVSDVRFVRGWFEDTLPRFNWNQPIAVLRLDGDWYDSTLCCLNHLYEQVAPGGLVIIDDYYEFDGCAHAVHDFLSRRKEPVRIRELGGVCYLVKPETS